MLRKTKLKIVYYLNAALIALLVGYQLYLNLSETQYTSLHLSKIEAIQTALKDKTQFEFIVVGNINNSSAFFRSNLSPH